MTKEDKDLLLKDLCARLPYGVKIDREWIAPMSGSPERSIMELDTFDIEVIKSSIELGEEGNSSENKMIGVTHCDDGKIHFVREYMCKPYLRSMSSMTEEEVNECYGLQQNAIHRVLDDNGDLYQENIDLYYFGLLIDFYHSHHLDYRGLIPMGLALEAKEGMYNK